MNALDIFVGLLRRGIGPCTNSRASFVVSPVYNSSLSPRRVSLIGATHDTKIHFLTAIIQRKHCATICNFRIVAMKFPEWFYCRHTCINTAYWGGSPSKWLLPLITYALSPTILPLLETFFELLFWNNFQYSCQRFPASLQYPEIFLHYKADFWFLGQKLLHKDRLVRWSIVMVGYPIVGSKFRPFSTHVTVPLSKFACIAIVLILKRLSECISFPTFSTFSSVLWDIGRLLFSLTFTFLRPSLNRLYHTKTFEFCTASSP